jgi:hypothetical protein
VIFNILQTANKAQLSQSRPPVMNFVISPAEGFVHSKYGSRDGSIEQQSQDFPLPTTSTKGRIAEGYTQTGKCQGPVVEIYENGTKVLGDRFQGTGASSQHQPHGPSCKGSPQDDEEEVWGIG